MREITIGIDASRANRDQKTGVEWYANFVIQHMKEISLEEEYGGIKFMLYSDTPLTGELADLPPNWKSKVLRWPPKRLWTQARLSLEMLFNPPDILFIPAHVFPIIHPKKTVMTVHDIAAFHYPQAYNWFERWYSLYSARLAVTKLWKVITPSQFTKDDLLSFVSGTNMNDSQAHKGRAEEAEKKINVIHLGYDERYDNSDGVGSNEKENLLTRYSIQRPYIISIGRLEEKKNTARIVEAYTYLRDNFVLDLPTGPILVLVGKPGYGYDKVIQAIDKSKYKDDIICLGWISSNELAQLISQAFAFVFPSFYEGFGVPILEAMASGVPVICSNRGSLPEIGGNAPIYVDPEDIGDIAQSIGKVLRDDNELRKKIAEEGYMQAAKFSWRKTAKKTLNLLLCK